MGTGGIGQDHLWKQVGLTKCVCRNGLREQVGLVKIVCVSGQGLAKSVCGSGQDLAKSVCMSRWYWSRVFASVEYRSGLDWSNFLWEWEGLVKSVCESR